MPALSTPVSGVTRRAPSSGGLPPAHLPPTGGGGGGGEEDRARGLPAGPGERLYRVRIFLLSFLAADLLFFVLLVFLFFARQSGTHMDPLSRRFVGDWHPVLLPPILFLNTAALVLSSLTMELARHHIFREFDVLEEWLGLGRPALRRALAWVAVTLLLGVAFLAGQLEAWRQLMAQGFSFGTAATPASNFFYILTGVHAVHLVCGVLFLALCLPMLRLFGRVESRQIAIDTAAWYWHAMGLAWVLLYGVLLWGQ